MKSRVGIDAMTSYARLPESSPSIDRSRMRIGRPTRESDRMLYLRTSPMSKKNGGLSGTGATHLRNALTRRLHTSEELLVYPRIAVLGERHTDATQ